MTNRDQQNYIRISHFGVDKPQIHFTGKSRDTSDKWGSGGHLAAGYSYDFNVLILVSRIGIS